MSIRHSKLDEVIRANIQAERKIKNSKKWRKLAGINNYKNELLGLCIKQNPNTKQFVVCSFHEVEGVCGVRHNYCSAKTLAAAKKRAKKVTRVEM